MHLQSDNPTSSTSSSTPTTTTSTTASSTEINDRVPSINLSADDHAVSITATIEQLPQPKSDTVSASYTLQTSSRNHDKLNSPDKQQNSDKISASYTILPQPPPLTSSNTTVVASKEKLPNDVDINRRTSTPPAQTPTTTTVTATINVPNKATIKTENDEIIESNRTSQQTVSQKTSSNNSPDDVEQLFDRDNQRSSRDKRSLFDIDNASSLTLAEKLRNEANKYNEVSKSNNDISQTNDIAVEFRKSDSTPSSPHHQISSAAERRPSWRLKFDAGNKV